MKKRMKHVKASASLPQGIGKDEDFHILHLSDLHIFGRVLGDRFDNMFKDIAKNTEQIESIVIVVTGDIASKGEVAQSKGAILDFFKKLKLTIKSRIIDIEIVPGNHDYDRKSLINNQSCEEALTQYKEICTKIYKIFGLKEEDQYKREVFGEKIIQFGDRSICFLRMDTSWFLPENQISDVIKKVMDDSGLYENSSDDEKDKILSKFIKIRKKFISKHVTDLDGKLKDRLDGCREKCKKEGHPVAVTFALAHHPLSWLLKTSCERYADFLLRKGFRNIDMWLCGHAHDVQIHYDNDNNQSTVVLMTGVGTAETGKDRHRYSLYKFSLIRNIFAIKVRAALTGGEFEDDNSLLPTDIFEKRQHFCYPLKTVTPGAVMPLNEAIGFDSKEMYVDQTALELMRGVVERMKELGLRLMDVVRNYLMDVAVALCKDVSDSEMRNTIFSAIYLREIEALNSDAWHQFMETERQKVETIFRNFLSDICDAVVAVILMQLESEADVKRTLTFNKDEKFWLNTWRVHFRVLAKDEESLEFDTYKCVTFSGCRKADLKSVQPVPWSNSQIMKAYDHPRMALVKSANDCKNPIDTNWDDFLTTIINHESNCTNINGQRMPVLTFGISVKEENYESRYVARRILYLFDFFDLNNIISRAVSEFINRVGLVLRPGMMIG
ncbi:MAG: metallophosphoesterase [Kiritimatiellae bacterium]|nr:metallophosphoesterase [Kiritimatiellia bacterium]